MPPVLAGRRVIEVGSMLAAPFATHMLAQLGADVIKVESPAGDNTRTMLRGGAGGSFIACNRGKRSVCIDLKTTEGQEVLRRLVASADIVVHNLAPHSARALKLAYEDCLAANPRIVYCHIRGYAAGPLAEELASNPVVEAATGVMYGHRINGRPTRLGPSYHDQFAGAYAVIGILAAINAPIEDTQARHVELGLYETGLHVAGRDFVNAQLKQQLGVKPKPDADAGEFSMPGYGAYQTADDRWMYLIMLSDGHWRKFCAAMVLPQADDESLATVRQRKKRRQEVEEIVGRAVRALPLETAMTRLQAAGFGCTEVMPAEMVVDEPQARQPGKLQHVDFQQFRFAIPNLPLPHQRAALDQELPPPLLGQHTMQVLQSLGYDAAQCAALQEREIIAVLPQVGAAWAPVR